MTAPGRGGPGRGGPAIPNSVRGAVLVGLAVIVGIIGLQILDDSGTGSSITIGTSGTSAPTSTTAVGQQPKPHPPGQVSIKVYNASDVQGAGQQLTDKLKTFGYNMQPAATLNGTRKGTVVQCRSGYEGDGIVIAGFGIGNGATSGPFPESPPDGSGQANCIVFVGTA
jgi:LytR cell envelope-related transcriptional attenuator